MRAPALFGVGGKDFERRERTSKGVLFRHVEPWASPQSVFHGLRLLFAKGTQWVRGEIEKIYLRFKGRCVSGSKALKEDCARTIDNCFAISGPGESTIHLRCSRTSWW